MGCLREGDHLPRHDDSRLFWREELISKTLKDCGGRGGRVEQIFFGDDAQHFSGLVLHGKAPDFFAA
jgi:hypothetical protein